MSTKLEAMKATVEQELTTVDNELAELREQRGAVNDKIREKVSEQTELRSALARLGSQRGRKAKAAAAETVEAQQEQGAA